MIDLQLFAVSAAIAVNQTDHDGDFCLCIDCRANLILAFARDLARHNVDHGATDLNQSLAAAAADAWTIADRSVTDLLKFTVRQCYPEFAGEVKVSMTEVVGMSDLANIPTRGSA